MIKAQIRLSKPGQIKRFIASTMNKLNNGEIEEGKARALGYLASILLKAIETEDLEKKVKELEDIVERIQSGIVYLIRFPS